MRLTVLPLAVAAALLSAAAASAAPTCLDRSGETVRCGAAGAMPVGWSLPPEERVTVDPAPVGAWTLIGLICGLGGLFGLIATMPEFDGWRDSDWGEQEGDGE